MAIVHYKGFLGEFDYDDKEFAFKRLYGDGFYDRNALHLIATMKNSWN